MSSTESKPLFHVRTVQGSVIKSLFDTLKEILHDVSITFDPTGVKISAMDGSKVSLVHMKLNAESFEEYDCPKSYEIGINVANMFKLLRSASSHDSILFRYMEENPHVLEITIQNFEKNSLTKFEMKLIEIDSAYIEISDLEFDTIISIPSNYFQRLCRDMSELTSFLWIEKKSGVVSFCSDYLSATDFASQRTILGDSDTGTITLVEDADYSNKFSLKYLIGFAKASGLSPVVELYLKSGFPLVLKYSIGSIGNLKFVIAPAFQ
jgi:proliferating cell nuclear antigen